MASQGVNWPAGPGFAAFGATRRCQSPGNSFAGRVSGSGGPFPTRIVSDSWSSGNHEDPSVLHDRGGRLRSDAPFTLSSDSEQLAGRIPNRRSASLHVADPGGFAWAAVAVISPSDRQFDPGYNRFLVTGLGSCCWVPFRTPTQTVSEPGTNFGFGHWALSLSRKPIRATRFCCLSDGSSPERRWRWPVTMAGAALHSDPSRRSVGIDRADPVGRIGQCMGRIGQCMGRIGPYLGGIEQRRGRLEQSSGLARSASEP